MRLTRRLGSIAAATALVAGAGIAAAPAASASGLGENSLAAVLTSDGNRFDKNWYDFDIVTEAVLTVLAAKPSSPVGVLADGSVPLTAFVPTDKAFAKLVTDLTGSTPATEYKTFTAVTGLGVDTVEAVLLYHVVPGATIDSSAALASDGAKLTTALGSTFTVDVLDKPGKVAIRFIDNDPDDANAHVLVGKLDINKGNKQIAHGIGQVLRPINL
ncbi:MAG: fasciclin domain-containing protein [Actinomycetia bacterium]|jgi:uncharacterized surface protein with fasciclin (FAS1) repeats|nr:fasciclin domain-containing protein [Actinomycetes bacterium]